MQTKFIKFTKFEVEKIWPLARDLVQLACETNGAFDVDDIKDMCKTWMGKSYETKRIC